MSSGGEHVGVNALLAERKELLDKYDAVKMKGADDAVQTQHGNAAEDFLRTLLSEFLPKKYGVTKGYIISPNPAVGKHLEEWDVIIYDALESPVLFGRPILTDPRAMRAIPVEFVKAVFEVKATFTVEHANDVVEKLHKLQVFHEPASKEPWDKALPDGFFTGAFFFETKVKDAKDFSAAIDALTPLWDDPKAFGSAGALIIRSQNHYDRSAAVGTIVSQEIRPDDETVLEHGRGFKSHDKNVSKESWEYVTSFGFSVNTFWSFMIDLIHALNDWPTVDGKLTGPARAYGIKERTEEFRKTDMCRLFPPAASTTKSPPTDVT